MTTPNWIAASGGQAPLAAHVNQLIGTHASTLIYTGALAASQTGTSTGSVNSNGVYLAQSFTTPAAGTTIGRIAMDINVTGTPANWVIQIQTNSAGAPSGTVLVTTTIPVSWANAGATFQSIPLPVTGLTAATTYWVVAQPAGDVSDYFTWFNISSGSGAATSTNGSTWTSQSYGFLYQAYDKTAVLPMRHTWEDSGARITEFFPLNATPQSNIGSIEEYTAAQTSGQFAYSFRNLTFTSGFLTSVS